LTTNLNSLTAFQMESSIHFLLLADTFSGLAQNVLKSCKQLLAALQKYPVQIQEMCQPMKRQRRTFKRELRIHSESSKALGGKQIKTY
jgi:hypothetical protein